MASGHGGFFTVVNQTAASYFGVKALGSIFGIIVFFGTLSGSIGPIVAGWIFDVTGSYFMLSLCWAVRRCSH